LIFNKPLNRNCFFVFLHHMRTYVFSAHQESPDEKGGFDSLLKLFKELLLHTSGDVNEALSWLTELDKTYGLTNKDYSIGDFIEDLKKRGYIRDNEQTGIPEVTALTEQEIRRGAFDDLFGKSFRGNKGQHQTTFTGRGDEHGSENRSYRYGDPPETWMLNESIINAQIRQGTENWSLSQDDLEVRETEASVQTSTVIMIDISHSMILYGEDRITPSKKVALALYEWVKRKYPKDTIDVLVFGDDAWQIEWKDLPYLQVGPYHTNTVAGLELAMDILRRRKNRNKQIFMITDGKPSCLKENGHYYKNSFGLDRKIVNACLNAASAARRAGISITTFMIASDPYLQEFVREFSEANHGKAFFSGLNSLGEFMIEDFEKNRKRR
jgi:Ca-activated chloride channel family protein